MFIRKPSLNIQQELVEKLWIHLMASDENYGQQNDQEQGINCIEDEDIDTDTDDSDEVEEEDSEYDKESPFAMYGGSLMGLMKHISLKDGDNSINNVSKQSNEQTNLKSEKSGTCKEFNNCKNINKSDKKTKNQLKEVNKVIPLKPNNSAYIKPFMDNQSDLKKFSRLQNEKAIPKTTQKSQNKSTKSSSIRKSSLISAPPSRYVSSKSPQIQSCRLHSEKSIQQTIQKTQNNCFKSSNTNKVCLVSAPPSRYVSSKSPQLQRVWRPTGKTEIRVHNWAPSNSGITAHSKSLTKGLTKQQSLDTDALSTQKKHISNLGSSGRTHSLDITDQPVLNKIPKKISRTHSLDITDHPVINKLPKQIYGAVSQSGEAYVNNCHNGDERKTIMQVSGIFPAQAEASTFCKVLDEKIPSKSSSSNMYTIEEIDTGLDESRCENPVSQEEESTSLKERENDSLQTNIKAAESVTSNPNTFNVRLEACLKDAVVDVLGGLPDDWLHSPDNTAEVFLFFMSALESFPRPHYTLKQVLGAILHRHENFKCGKPEKGEASCVKTPHLLLYIGIKLCAVNAQGNQDLRGINQEPDVKILLLKLLAEIRKCEGHFDRLMLCILLGSRAPGRGCGWYCETEEEEEKVRDLTYIFANIGHLENCSVVDLVSEPIWSLGSSPVVVAALADASELLLVLLQHGAGESQQQHLTYKADPIQLSIAFVVRKLASVQHVRLATELQPPKPGLDLFKHTVNTPTLMCLRYLLRTVPWVPAKYLNQHVTGSIRDVALVLPGVYIGLEPPTLKHLARCATRSSLRLHGLLPYGLDQVGLPATLKDYVNLIK